MSCDKMRDIENILKTRIENDEANTFVVIVPTDAARLKRQRELVGYHPNRAVADLRVYNIENFVQRLYTQVRPSRRHISQGLQTLWFHEIANNTDAYPYEAFRPSQDISVPDSTLSLIADTINRLRERGETPQNIIRNNPTRIDLAHIYSDYEAKLEDLWIDEQGRHLHLANNFDPRFMRNAFPRVNLVVVEGFTVLSQADIKILTCIARMPNIEMYFRTDCVEENEDLYKNITKLVSQFKAVDVQIDTTYEREPSLHQHFANNLFCSDTARITSVPNSDMESQITLLEPADRSEEVEQIAHQIQKHVSEGTCQLSDICVAYYNVGYYQQRIAETFPAYGIPYSLVESVPLTKSEVVKAIFSRLSSRRVPLGDVYFGTSCKPKLAIEKPDVEPASHTRLFQPIEFQAYVDGLLADGAVVQHILNPMFGQNRKIVEGEVEAYRQFNRIVKELCEVLKSEGNETDFLDNYIEKLHYIARHTNYQNRATANGETVRIVQLGELRSLEFDTVFLGDFVEGRFPENYRPDPLLPETPYRTEDEQLHDNRFMFYRVLKSFRKRLYLLVPKRERESELIPSPYLTQLRKVADVKEMKIKDPSQGSVPGFLSTYGEHIWTTDTPSNREFPDALVNIRPLINHVVAVEKSREKTHECLDYEGILTTEKLSAQSQIRLENRQQRVYSVTELETYAKCPFQYFVDGVLRFRVEEDETEDELSSLERGSLLHDVLRAFYNSRREQGYPSIGQCSVEVYEDAKRQLDEILNTKSEEHRSQRTETPIGEGNLFWEMDIEKLRVAVHKWLEAERTYDLPAIPYYFEINFGQSGDSADSELSCPKPIRIGDVHMKGKIDRIDLGNGAFNVVDYKTGSSTIRMPEILNGRSLQLPIYLQIAEKLLNGDGAARIDSAAGLYHKIRLDQCTVELGIGKESLNDVAYSAYNGTVWKSVGSRSGQLLANELFDERLARTRGYVQQYVDSISMGKFPLITRVKTYVKPDEDTEQDNFVEVGEVPEEYGFVKTEKDGDKPVEPSNKTQPCSYCNYKRVCRVGVISEANQSED